MGNVIYISYATPAYMGMMHQLHKSMIANGIPKDQIDFCQTADTGSWNLNTKKKVSFFISKFKQYEKQNCRIAWIDADAFVMDTEFKKSGIALPFYENFNGDIGMSYEYNQQMSRHGFLSNAFIFDTSPIIGELLEKWNWYTMRVQSRTPTQAAFKEMWRDWGITQCIKFIEQPVAYAWYLPKAHIRPYKDVIPIIKHDIASRRMHK